MAVDTSMNVLVVDDYKTMLRIIGNLMKQIGFKNVDDALDGPTALTKLRNAEFGLVISDWNMEPMTGLELLREVRNDGNLKHLPFIMVTAESKTENVIEAKKAGVNNYIVKPFDASTLKSKLESVLGSFSGLGGKGQERMTAQASGRTDGMGEAREKRIDDLCTERGETVRIDEIAEVVESLLASLDGDFNAFDLRVYREVQKLAEYIHSVKGELADLCPDELKEDFLPAAADEPDAIVKHTESATGTILDAAETLENVASSLGGEQGEAITDAVTNIYEACNFQDITGQRITKVVTTLQHIETELDKLVRVFGAQIDSDSLEQKRKARAAKTAADEDMLNGPSLPDQATKQDEIDALLASFD